MLPDNHKRWGIVEEERFREELAVLHPNPIRADEFVDGVKNMLCKDPTPPEATKIGGKVWFLPMRLGKAVVYYTFNDDYVYLLSIQVVE
jgi:hypothetical protein